MLHSCLADERARACVYICAHVNKEDACAFHCAQVRKALLL